MGVDSNKLQHRCRVNSAGVPSFFRFGIKRSSMSSYHHVSDAGERRGSYLRALK